MAHAREVVLVRHGETEWSASGRHTGRTDVPLTDQGRAQGADLARLLTRWQFVVSLTSPLQRAAETCELSGLEGTVDDDLREWDYGRHEGRTTEEIRRELPDWTIWRGPVPGGEHIDQVAARADRVITRIEQVDGDLALFSHGHLLRVLAARWLGLPPADGRLFMLDTATFSVLSTERHTRAIRLWNGFPRPEPDPLAG
jgi:probable phosphoglycerate mutase